MSDETPATFGIKGGRFALLADIDSKPLIDQLKYYVQATKKPMIHFSIHVKGDSIYLMPPSVDGRRWVIIPEHLRDLVTPAIEDGTLDAELAN